MAFELGEHPEEGGDKHVVDDQEERDDDGDGEVGEVGAAPIRALIIAEVPQVGLAEAGEIVAVACDGTIRGHLTAGVEDLAVDAEVVIRKKLVLLVLDVAEEHVAAEANGEGEDPADDQPNEGPFAFVLPDDHVRSRWLGERVLLIVEDVVSGAASLFLQLEDALLHPNRVDDQEDRTAFIHPLRTRVVLQQVILCD